uniref:Uncharacterized protein n=1 Tax=Sciurus vulgaris TaxID=55149 RepID=A0A8D2AK84_SCIVU
ITRDVEHFFIYLLIACTSSSVKCLFISLAHLLIGLFVFLVSLYILKINALSEVLVAKIFSPSVGFLFTLLIVFFAMKKLFSLMPFHLLIFEFISCTLGVLLRKSAPEPLC